MYNNEVILLKREVIPPIPDSMIPEDFCKKNYPSIILQLMTRHPTSIFLKNKMNNIYLTESIRIHWIHMLD